MIRRAFTLVELLVVIAIIALLISILAPSLRMAKDLAREMLCMTNQRGICQGILMYSQSYKGRIIPYDGVGNYLTPGLPSGACTAFNGTAVDPNGLLAGRQGFGNGYAAGFFARPEMLYCPGQLKNADLCLWADYTRYPAPWGSAALAGSDRVRTTYMYNPNSDGVKSVGSTLDKIASDKPLVSDMMYSQWWIGDSVGGNKWFMAFPDNHVSAQSSKRADVALAEPSFDAFGLWDNYNLVYSYVMSGR
jgi:prepilin-type N-terminal cleavage/methylation domain-containing protein